VKPIQFTAVAFVLLGQTRCAMFSRGGKNIRAFGATGDGTTKDTAAFQQAINVSGVGQEEPKQAA